MSLNLDLPIVEWAAEEGIDENDIRERSSTEAADKAAADRAERFGPEIMPMSRSSVVLQTLDHLWREHIVNLDHLRSVIGFRGYAQRDPLQEYKSRSLRALPGAADQSPPGRHRTTDARRTGARGRKAPQPAPPLMVAPSYRSADRRGRFWRQRHALQQDLPSSRRKTATRRTRQTWGKVARNEACPCGSGKKYKHCHGAFV